MWKLRMCERFGCLPSALAGEDGELFRMLEIEQLVNQSRGGVDYGERDQDQGF